jgi:lipopolysaccharide transport system ATP-binding protein
MEPTISISSLSKIFPTSRAFGRDVVAMYRALLPSEGKLAVDNVTLTINRGERLGIVGRNGAGKSTLLHMIAGLSTPSSGDIKTVGKITSILTLGVGLREDLSGRENIYVDAEIQGKSRETLNEAINEIIDFADLGEFINYPIRTYSTGMKARLAFSMISHIDPEILIIDEALSVGDAAFAAKATQRIREICARGKIVIIVSHSMQAVKDICNRCLWMDNGKILMDGTPEAVTSAYIEAVRAEDEVQLVDKFKKQIGIRSFDVGWQIKAVALYSGADALARSLLDIGETARFVVAAELGDEGSYASIQVQIKRLDGLLVFSEAFPARQYIRQNGLLGFELAMTPLVLGAGIYKLEVAVIHNSVVKAESASIFEARASSVPTGGKPMLLYPITVSAHSA